jgi:hypothetical protein
MRWFYYEKVGPDSAWPSGGLHAIGFAPVKGKKGMERMVAVYLDGHHTEELVPSRVDSSQANLHFATKIAAGRWVEGPPPAGWGSVVFLGQLETSDGMG